MLIGDDVVVVVDRLEDPDIVRGDYGVIIGLDENRYLVDFRSIRATVWVTYDEIKAKE